MQQWQLRDSYFKGPGPYTLSARGNSVRILVDDVGRFVIPPGPGGADVPVGIYAKAVFPPAPPKPGIRDKIIKALTAGI